MVVWWNNPNSAKRILVICDVWSSCSKFLDWIKDGKLIGFTIERYSIKTVGKVGIFYDFCWSMWIELCAHSVPNSLMASTNWIQGANHWSMLIQRLMKINDLRIHASKEVTSKFDADKMENTVRWQSNTGPIIHALYNRMVKALRVDSVLCGTSFSLRRVNTTSDHLLQPKNF